MKIEVSEMDGGTIILKEVYNSIVLETAEGNQFAICMRDDTVEMTLIGTGKWFRCDASDGEIFKL